MNSKKVIAYICAFVMSGMSVLYGYEPGTNMKTVIKVSAEDAEPDSSDENESEEEPNPASDFIYSVFSNSESPDEIAITKYTGSDENVVFPDAINGVNVTKICSSVFSDSLFLTNIMGNKTVKSVYIPDTVTEIEESTFEPCIFLKSIDVSEYNYVYSSKDGVLFDKDKTTLICYPKGMENTEYTVPDCVKVIEDNAFRFASNLVSLLFQNDRKPVLESVTIPDGVTTIGDGAFYGQEMLSDIILPDSISMLGDSAFCGCRGLKSVKLPSEITELPGSAFYNCISLSSVVMPEKITKIDDYAFYGCKNLTEFTVPEGTLYLGNAVFKGCTALSDIVIPESVTEIGGQTFTGTAWLSEKQNDNPLVSVNGMLVDGSSCTGEVTVSGDFNTICSEAFTNNKGIETVVISEKVKKINSSAFEGCSLLKSVKLPEYLTEIETGTFRDCTGLTSVTLPGRLRSIGPLAFSGTALESIIIPKTVSSIGTLAFSQCSKLESVTIKGKDTAIAVDAFDECGAFSLISCYEGSTAQTYAEDKETPVSWLDLPEETPAEEFRYEKISDDEIAVTGYTGERTEIVIPSAIDGMKVTEIGYKAFEDNDVTESIVLPEGIKKIGSLAFYGCELLYDIDIPESVTCIEDGAFYGCSMLDYIKIPENVTYIREHSFSGCSSLSRIELPESILGIDDYAFNECVNLENITIPEKLKTIGEFAFQDCKKIRNIHIPSSVNYIGDRAFDGTQWISDQQKKNPLVIVNDMIVDGYKITGDVIIPDTVKKICDGAFQFNSEINSVTMHDGMISIGERAFFGCANLAKTEIPKSVTEIGGDAFGGTPWMTEQLSLGPCVTVNGILLFVQECENILNLEGNITAISDRVFSQFENLERIRMPYVTSIGESAFSYCNNLRLVSLRSGITAIRDYTFYNCESLAEIEIPEGVESIGKSAFAGCTMLAAIVIPPSVEYIDKSAFYGCERLMIHGYNGSYACEYAQENNIEFVSLGEYEAAPPEDNPSVTEPDEELPLRVKAGGIIEVSAGDTVIVPVYVENPGNGYSAVSFNYELPEDFKVEGVTKGECTGSVIWGENVRRINFLTYNGVNSTEDGVLINIAVSVPEETVPGNYIFKVSGLEVTTFDGEEQIRLPEDKTAAISGILVVGEKSSVTTTEAVTEVPITTAETTMTTVPETTVTTTVTTTEAVTEAPVTTAETTMTTVPETTVTTTVTTTEAVTEAPVTTAETTMTTVPETTVTTTVTTTEAVTEAPVTTAETTMTTVPETTTTTTVTTTEAVTEAPVTTAETTMTTVPEETTEIAVTTPEPEILSGTCGNTLEWSFSDGVLSIEGTGDIEDYSASNRHPWSHLEGRIKNVVLSEGVTGIGNSAFMNCQAMKEIYVGSGIARVGSYAFQNCIALEKLSFSERLEVIESDAFLNCTNLNKINVSCKTAIKANIPDGVLDLDHNFTDEICSADNLAVEATCDKPAYYYLICENCGFINNSSIFANGETAPHSWKASEDAFEHFCENCDTEPQEHKYSNDGKCEICGAEKINLHITIKITEKIYYAGERLQRGDLFVDTENSDTLGGMLIYEMNRGLEEGDNTIDWYFVADDKNYAVAKGQVVIQAVVRETKPEVTEPVETEPPVTEPPVTEPPADEPDITEPPAEEPPADINSGSLGEHITYSIDDNAVMTVSGEGAIPDYDENSSPFTDRKDIQKVIFSEGITDIGDFLFYQNRSVQEIVLPSTLKSIGRSAFSQCYRIENADIPEGVREIETGAFQECLSLGSVVLREGLESIGGWAFEKCSGLTSVAIPDSVNSVGEMVFSKCTGLKEIYISESLLDAIKDLPQGVMIKVRSSETEVTDMSGDADGNGVINSMDLVCMIESIISGNPPENRKDADIDKDNIIGVSDLILLKKKLMK